MKQASYSLLTLCPIPFKAKLCMPALFRDRAWAASRLFTPFHICRKSFLKTRFSVLLASCPLRSFVRSRLGEGRIRSLLSTIYLILTVAIFIPPASGSGSIVVKLKDQVSVQSNRIVLNDIAEFQGTDSGQLAQLAQVPLGNAPRLGIVATLSRYQLSGFIQKVMDPIPAISFEGAEVVQIKLQGRPVESEEITRILKDFLIKTLPWKESEIEIQSIEHPQGIELPPGEAQLQISSRLPVTGRGRIIFPFEIVQEGKVIRNFWTTTKINVNKGVFTAQRPIRVGKVIELEDVVLSGATISDFHATYLRTLDEILGKVAQRNLSPGDPLTRESFADPILIKRGETIQLRLQRSGIALTAKGRAEQDGRLGQTIRVRNMEFSTLLNAQITGPGEAKIQ
jgi:flagellar basal body P-ring formation protein FlgA